MVASWTRRASILKQYVVSGQLKVQSELLNVDGVAASALGSNIDDARPEEGGQKKVATTLDSKTRGRLEQLEATAEAKEAHTVRLTQQELVSRVDKLNGELRKAWEGEERVRALKIAIQVSKMLGDTAFPQFFPSVFVLVTEMLDNFGELVYARVHAKGAGGRASPTTSRRRCARRASRRRRTGSQGGVDPQLVPRFYVELAIIRCYRMLMPASELPTVLRRMVRMVRGFGDPLAATYARSYLVHKAMQVAPHMTQQLVQEPLWDTFTVYKQQLRTKPSRRRWRRASRRRGRAVPQSSTSRPSSRRSSGSRR